MNPYGGDYRRLDILAADPLELVARVCEAAAEACDSAKRACATGDIAAKGNAVRLCTTAIGILRGHLNMEKGGDVALNFDRAYGLILTRLTHAHATNDLAVFDEVKSHLLGLQSAWEEASSKTREAAAGPPAPGVDVRR